MKQVVNCNKELGMRIRYLRKSKDMTLESLSFESDVNRNYLGDMERGRRNPTLVILQRVAHGLGVTLEELFKGIN